MSIIKFKKKEQEVAMPCTHDSLNIDRANKQITCRDCDAVLDPFEEIMNYSDALDDFRERLEFIRGQLQQDSARNQIVARRLENKQRTKCQHCKKMTEVKIKEPLFEQMLKAGVPTTEHIQSGKFWADAKKAVREIDQFELFDMQQHDEVACTSCTG